MDYNQGFFLNYNLKELEMTDSKKHKQDRKKYSGAEIIVRATYD
jgi:hypothetical protein